MGAMLKFLFFFLLIVYLFALAGKLLLKGFVNRRTREFAERYADAQRQQQKQQRQQRHREGEVTVERIEVKEKQVSRKVGEYVEYEEIEQIKEEQK